MTRSSHCESASEPESNPARERVLAAAMGAFMERGYAGTSTLAIATRARVSKRDLYTHFANKQAMLAACIAERTRRMRLPFDLPRVTDLDALAAVLRRFAEAVLRETTKPEVTELFRLAIAEVDRSPEIAHELHQSGSVANREALANVLGYARDLRLVQGDPAVMVTRFLSLVWDDLRMQLLLRTSRPPNAGEISRRARMATEALLMLHASRRPNGVLKAM
jgi:AcrR family transcriptional regulator